MSATLPTNVFKSDDKIDNHLHYQGTMLAGHPVADLVIVLKETPAPADIENLSVKVQEKLKENTGSYSLFIIYLDVELLNWLTWFSAGMKSYVLERNSFNDWWLKFGDTTKFPEIGDFVCFAQT